MTTPPNQGAWVVSTWRTSIATGWSPITTRAWIQLACVATDRQVFINVFASEILAYGVLRLPVSVDAHLRLYFTPHGFHLQKPDQCTGKNTGNSQNMKQFARVRALPWHKKPMVKIIIPTPIASRMLAFSHTFGEGIRHD